MKKCYSLYILFFLIISSLLHAQKWTTYDYNNSNYAITASNCIAADANGNIWIGAYNSLVKFDQNKTWTVYNPSNTPGFPYDKPLDIVVDGTNTIWFCTGSSGFYNFNNVATWLTYTNKTTNGGLLVDWTYCMTFDNAGNLYLGIYCGNSKNAGLTRWNRAIEWNSYVITDSHNYKNVEALAKDKQGNIWCGTTIGAYKYDPIANTWTAYTKENTSGGICGNYVRTINVDSNGNIWFGCMDYNSTTGSWEGGGLSKFNGSSWTYYKPSNSGLTNGVVSAIAFRNNEVWVGTGFCGQYGGNGLYKFDGTNWTNYYNSTSTFPGTCVNDITVDKNNNVWVAGANIVTKIDYTTDIEKTETLPGTFQLLQNYPNPFNPTTTIRYTLKEPGNTYLKIYDLIGRELAVLVNEYQYPGYYSVEFDAGKLTAGTYFYKLRSGSLIDVKKMVLIK